MRSDTDHPISREVSRDTDTRFGPRPAFGGHEPPRHVRDEQGNRAIAIGGTVVMAAAATAGLILGARKVAQMIAGPDERPQDAPRFRALDEDEREAMRRRARAQARNDARRAAQLRAAAAQRRAGGNVADRVTDRAGHVAGSLNNAVASMAAAVDGFRSVAGQAGGIMRDFTEAAATVRMFLNSGRAGAAVDARQRGPRRDAQ